MKDILVSSIYSVELVRSLAEFIKGLIIIVVGFLVYYYAWDIADTVSIASIGTVDKASIASMIEAVGIVVMGLGLLKALIGWFNRFLLRIYYPGGRLTLRGGGELPEIAASLRRALVVSH
jgi:hypothetical protein